MKSLLLLLAFLLSAAAASAQAVTGPTLASFQLGDATPLTGVQLAFYQCTSVTGAGAATVGVGCAAAPFQGPVTIPIASVTTIAPDAFGNTRTVPLTAPPVSGLLGSVPVGVPFVATLAAVGDPAVGASTSLPSAASNPFFSGLKVPAAPLNVKTR